MEDVRAMEEELQRRERKAEKITELLKREQAELRDLYEEMERERQRISLDVEEAGSALRALAKQRERAANAKSGSDDRTVRKYRAIRDR